MNKKIIKIKKVGAVSNPKHDSKFGDSQPSFLGYWTGDPIVGQSFRLMFITDSDGKRGIITSTVLSVSEEDQTFSTLNSIYKWEEYKENSIEDLADEMLQKYDCQCKASLSININQRTAEIERDKMIHPSTKAAIIRELKRFESWITKTEQDV